MAIGLEDQQRIAHGHSTHAVAVPCLADLGDEPIPPLTPYFVLRVGRLGRVPCFLPGSTELATAVGQAAKTYRSLLLANHGPVIMRESLETAVYASEELEQAAHIFLLRVGRKLSPIPPDQLTKLRGKG